MGSFPDESTLSKNDGVDDWGTLTTIAESPLDPSILYAGTDDGRIQLSRDGGKSFESLEGNLTGCGSEACDREPHRRLSPRRRAGPT